MEGALCRQAQTDGPSRYKTCSNVLHMINTLRIPPQASP